MLQKCATLVAAAAVVIAAGCAQTDAGITTNVKTKMAADDTVKAYQIDVDTRNGVVTLTGDVETAAAKEQAVQIARNTEGVRDVVDQIRVADTAATGGFFEQGRDAGDRLREGARDLGDRAGDAANRTGAAVSDAAVTAAVKAKLLADGTVRGLNIDVDTRAGVVVLNGTVSSRAEADRAVMLARNTDGVDNVVDNLKVGR
ncbi:MAG: BON domain-containing protein [Candidatus Rokuibacteriota bacterium]